MTSAIGQLPETYTLENVWGTKAPELQTEIIDFWLAAGALPSREQATARVDQVIVLGRTTADRQIVAVSTVYEQFNQQLGHPFYYFRCFVDEAHRRASLALHLLVAARQELNARFVAGENPRVLGMVLEVQNAAITQELTQAVWPRTGFVYIGRNARGDQVRIAYFDGARIA
jgi:hypothetical protein